MPVAEEPYDISVYAKWQGLKKSGKEFKDERLKKLKEQQLIPMPVQQNKVVEVLMYNGLWLILTYGADLLTLVAPWLGKGFSYLVKWKFDGQWDQKKLGIK